VLDRVSADDLMSLVGSGHAAPVQVGAVLVLGRSALNPSLIRLALTRSLPAVPRLRQRLAPVPFGCGRPVWLDHEVFDLDEHFLVHQTSSALSHQGLLDLAAELVARPLSRDRPLWSVTFVPDVVPGCSALVAVFHHVLADGVAAVSLLAHLLAGKPGPDRSGFPQPEPSRRALLLDAARSRLTSLGGLPTALVRLGAAALAVGPTLWSRAEPCSLNQPGGNSRCLRVLSTDLQGLITGAHQQGATVNDVILTVVAGALSDLLAGRGEHVQRLVVSVPFSIPARDGVSHLGNHSGVVAVRLPTAGSFAERLASAATTTAAAKRHLRGASTAVLAPVFRVLDRLGLFEYFVNHQRLIHTFVSNLRGPEGGLEILGQPLVELIPLSQAGGNVSVAFTALSYHGRLTITVNADPVTCPDLDRLCRALKTQLQELSTR
jgi:diacylglycerol O-acyltransferase